jgi:hypothetical protein
MTFITGVSKAFKSDVLKVPLRQTGICLAIGVAGVFGEAKAGPAQEAVDVKTLHAKIGQLTLENDFLEGALTKAGLLSAKR